MPENYFLLPVLAISTAAKSIIPSARKNSIGKIHSGASIHVQGQSTIVDIKK